MTNSPQEMRPNEKAVLAMLRERATRLAHGDCQLAALLKSAEGVAPVLAAMPKRWQRADFDADKED